MDSYSKTFYVEAIQNSNAAHPWTEIRASYNPGVLAPDFHYQTVAYRAVKVTNVSFDLRYQQLDETTEEKPGGLINANLNDNNNDGQIDALSTSQFKDINGNVITDPDLVPLEIHFDLGILDRVHSHSVSA